MSKLAIPFGNPTTYAGHSGIDFPVPRGTPFHASAPGRVTWLGWNAIGGYFIWVKYDAITPEVGYHHMDSHNGCPVVGSRVSEGSRLGYVGSSGRSTGPHLHSEVAENRTTDGYWKYFDRNRVVGAGAASSSSTPAAKPTTPAKTPQPTLEDLMALKNVTIATENGKNQYDSTTLDFETGMKSSLSKTNATYTTTVAKYLTGQGSLTITRGHYNNLLREFDAHFKAKREHELAVARARA